MHCRRSSRPHAAWNCGKHPTDCPDLPVETVEITPKLAQRLDQYRRQTPGELRQHPGITLSSAAPLLAITSPYSASNPRSVFICIAGV